MMGELKPCEGVMKASAFTNEDMGIAARSREAMSFMVIVANLSKRKDVRSIARVSNTQLRRKVGSTVDDGSCL